MVSQDIKVSVIVPIYNVENYVYECIYSITKQYYKNLEIILVDDGSPDKSGKICDEFAAKDKRIICIHKINEGVSAARNSGLKAATGDYVCFVDGDDYVEPEYVLYLLNLCLKNNTEISLTKGIFDTFVSKNQNADSIEVVTGEEAAMQILTYKIHIGVYCKIFSRDFLKRNDVHFNKNIKMGEGFNFNTYAFQRADRVAIGHKQIYFYRRNNLSSATVEFNKERWENGFYAIDCIQKDIFIKTKNIENAVKFARWHTYFDAFNNAYCANAKKTEKNFYKKCRSYTKKHFYSAFKVNVSCKERLRALISFIFPELIAKRNLKKLRDSLKT